MELNSNSNSNSNYYQNAYIPYMRSRRYHFYGSVYGTNNIINTMNVNEQPSSTSTSDNHCDVGGDNRNSDYLGTNCSVSDTNVSYKFNLQDMCECYTVAYNSPERAAKMTERFSHIGLNLNVHKGVQMDDSRLSFAREDDISAKRLASVFYGHLDNIAKFYETGKPYGLFCEDDVHIHKDLGKELPIIIGEFNAMQLDILLLGYMTTKTIEWWQSGYQLVYDGASAPYRYHRYPNDQWGIHLFMISRSYAKTLLEVYGPDYAAKSYNDPSITCCNPDWTLSKYTANRALRYPMMAVEDGKGDYEHHGQGEFHRESHKMNYRDDEFF